MTPRRCWVSSHEYLKPKDHYVTVVFGEMEKGKFVTKGTYAKMARGEMVRYMAEHQIEDPDDIRAFDRLGYVYREDLSSGTQIVFERIDGPKGRAYLNDIDSVP